jgi:hypothetical protein
MEEEDLISSYVLVHENEKSNVTLDFSEVTEVDATKVSTLNYSESCGLAVEHSAHDQKVVGSIPMLVDGSGVKAMPGSITTPNSGSLQKNKKIQVAKWGTPKKVL